MEPVRYAVVGFGLAGSAFHAPLIATCPGARMAAFVVRSEESVQAVRAAYPDAVTVPRIQDLGDLGIDVVVVATPNATHADLAVEVMESGMAAVVDKPLATSVADAERMIATAERLGVPLTCYQNRRWDGDFLTVRRLARDDRLGPIHRFESRFERWRPQVRVGWKETPTPGAGILFDLGPHIIDQAIQLLGPVAETYSEVRVVRPRAQVCDDSFVALHHESGAVSHLWASLVCAAPGPRFRVLGGAAAYLKGGIDPQEEALRAGRVPRDADWGADPESAWGFVVQGDERRMVRTENGDYPQFYRLMTAAVVDPALPLPVDPLDSLAGLRIIESAMAGA